MEFMQSIELGKYTRLMNILIDFLSEEQSFKPLESRWQSHYLPSFRFILLCWHNQTGSGGTGFVLFSSEGQLMVKNRAPTSPKCLY